MRTLLLAVTPLLALSASLASAAATTIGYTGSLQSYTVPNTGFYQIEATGGSGGTVPYRTNPDAVGGKGADVTGDFALIEGEVLSILVGGKGGNGPSGIFDYGSAGGGGGSFVVGPGNTPWLIAGGGGGGGGTYGEYDASHGADAREVATKGKGSNGGAAGVDGGGGGGGCSSGSNVCSISSQNGGGGGTLLSSGGNGYGRVSGAGGSSVTAGGAGGQGNGKSGTGGFGGGGGGGGCETCGGAYSNGGGGGGGGYNGGGGGNSRDGGGAGGSFAGGPLVGLATFMTAKGTGNSLITITELSSEVAAPVPEPASLTLLGIGLAGLGLLRRRRG